MASFINQQLTDVGWDALSTALGGGTLTFYKMQAGDGTIANDDVIPPMTALVNPVCDIGITKYTIEGDGQVTLWGNIVSAEIDSGFYFRELAVFATIEAPAAYGGVPGGPNITVIKATGSVSPQSNPVVPVPGPGTPIMYSYCNAYASADYIPGKNESTSVVNTIQVTVKIDKAISPIINITEGTSLEVANIGAPSVGAGPWSYTQANIAWLKRLVAGPATLITEDANTITIGQKQLTQDLDLYVANGNPDISPNFSSIQNAMNYLGQYIIPTSIAARIHVSAGTYVSPNTIFINHPNGQSITIQGPQTVTQVGTSLSIAGSAGNWNMSINGLGDTSEFVVNNYAIINYIGGVTNGHHALGCGAFKVISKTATSVTVRVPNYKASFSIVGASAIKITPINVLLTCSTKNTAVVYVISPGLKLMRYMCCVPTILPDYSTFVLLLTGNSSLEFMGAADFRVVINPQGTNLVYGFYAGATCTFKNCASSNNLAGFVSGANGSFSMDGCASSYNTLRGLYAEGGIFQAYNQPSFVGGNGETGISLATNASMAIIAGNPPGFVLCQGNDGYGLWCSAGGSINFSNTTCTLLIQDSGVTQPQKYDVVVTNLGVVNANQCITGSRIFNATVGVMKSDGGLIN